MVNKDEYFPWTYYPRTFPLPDNSPSVFTQCSIFPPFHQHHLPIYNIKLSTVNVYKTDSGSLVTVRSTALCQFLNFRFNIGGYVLSGEGNCQGGRNVQRGNVLHSRRHNSIPYPNPYTTSYFMHMIAGN